MDGSHLRQSPPGKTARSQHNVGTRNAVVEQAIREREDRARQRQSEVLAVKVQKHVRGHLARKQLMQQEKQDFDRKISDIDKLSKALATKGVPFQLPEPTATRLLRQLLFLRRSDKRRPAAPSSPAPTSDHEHLSRLNQLSVLALLPGLRTSATSQTSLLAPAASAFEEAAQARAKPPAVGANAKASVAIATGLAALWRLKQLTLVCLDALTHTHGDSRGTTLLDVLVALLTGGGEGGREESRQDTDAAGGGGLRLFRRALWEQLLSKECHLYSGGRRKLVALPNPEVVAPTEASKIANAQLFEQVLLWPIMGHLGPGMIQVATRQFLTEILTIPLLTMHLSQATLEAIASKSIWTSVLTECSQNSPSTWPRPPPGYEMCDSPTWLLGNLVVLSLRGDAWSASQVETENRVLLTMQLQTFARLLEVVPHGVLDERSDVAWKSKGEGGTKVAVVIPEALRRQLRLLVYEPAVRSMVRCSLLGLLPSKLLSGKTADEANEEKELAKNGLLMSTFDDTCNGTQATSLAAVQVGRGGRSKRWLGSQWARQLRGAVEGMLASGPSQQLAAGGSAAAAAGTSSSSSAPAAATATPPVGPVVPASAPAPAGAQSSISSMLRGLLLGGKTQSDTSRRGQKARLLEATGARGEDVQVLEDTTASARLAAAGGATPNLVSGGSKSSSQAAPGRRKANGATVVPVVDASETLENGGAAGECSSLHSGDQAGMSNHHYDVDAAATSALGRMCCVLLMRWPASGTDSVGKTLLDTLSFSTEAVPQLWLYLQTQVSPGLTELVKDLKPALCGCSGVIAVVALFAVCYGHLLSILDEFEMYDDEKPLPLFQVRRLVRSLKVLLFRGLWGPTQLSIGSTASGRTAGENLPPAGQQVDNPFAQFLVSSVGRLLRCLHSRSSRRPFCLPEAWLVSDLSGMASSPDFVQQKPPVRRLLSAMPYALSFSDRMRLFQRLAADLRRSCQPDSARPLRLDIRRGHVLEDGFHQIMRARPGDLRARLAVVYTSVHGHVEAGVDMGGLFKDFWTDLSAQAFSPDYGLFNLTPGGLLFPNPRASLIHGEGQFLDLFAFMGRVVGKALYENITVQPQFAHFFLSKLLGHVNSLNDLPSFDAELYKNLMFLKSYTGDVEDLSLTFTVMDAAYGAQQEIPLMHGGADIPVTAKNRFRYIHMVADYHLNKQLKAQSDAFLRGLLDIIPAQWIQMFNEPELQVLISGSFAPIDVDDLRRNTKLIGGFLFADKHVDRFFRCMQEFDGRERAKLLAFVTGCSRPPSLGFEAMEPPFTLQKVPISSDEDRLPTASTCFNVLKLPTYSSQKVMKDKLLISIHSGAGFELT